MKKKQFFIVLGVLLFLLSVFSQKFILKGYIPFPGDLLINSHAPWKFYSYLGYNPGSYPTKFQYFDVARQLYPWKVYGMQELQKGNVPLWNPYNFAGTPLLANGQSQVFSPLNLFYFALPPVYGWTASLFFQIILTFVFTYLYARKIKIGVYGSLLASIGFSCSLYMSVFFQYGVMGQTIMWLPLLLYGIEELLQWLSIRGVGTIALALAGAGFGGHLQVYSYIVGLAVIYGIVGLFQTKQYILKKAITIAGSLLLGVGMGAVQLVPTLELIGLSARVAHGAEFFSQHLLKFSELILFISPDFFGNPASNNFLLQKSYPETALYIGIIPFIFALSVLFSPLTPRIKFFIGTFILVLLGTSVNPLSSFLYSLSLPFLSSSSPTNSMFLIGFSLSVLAGYGMDAWITKKSKNPLLTIAVLLGLIVITTGVYIIFHLEFNLKSAMYSMLLLGIALVIFVIARFGNARKILIGILLVVTIFDLYYFFQKFNPFVPNELVYPEAQVLSVLQQKVGINRVWGYGDANIPANENILYGFSSPEGYDPLYPKRYGELLYAAKDGKLLKKFTDRNRSDAVFESSRGSMPANTSTTRVFNMLGIKYVVDRVENGSTEKTFPQDNFVLIYDKDGWKIFENKQAVPRIFLTSEYAMFRTPAEFEKIFFNQSFNFSQKILLEENPNFQSKKNNSTKAMVRVVHYGGSYVEVHTENKERALLFISDLFYPGWKAYIDGREVKILRANYAFRAVEVPQGKHIVNFVYQPTSFTFGTILSLFSIGILLIVGILIYMRILHYEKK